MESPHSGAGPAEPAGPASQTQFAAPAQMAREDGDARNRFLLFLRSIPVVSALLNGTPNSGALSSSANHVFVAKCLVLFYLIFLVLFVATATAAIYYFNIRFYKVGAAHAQTQTRPSETLIVCWLLRAIWSTINGTWEVKYQTNGETGRSNLSLSQTFYNISSILWISLAVVFMGVTPKEDTRTTSVRICYFLLWVTITSYVLPMLVYTFLSIFVYLVLALLVHLRNGSVGATGNAMPAKLLRKLEVARFADVVARLERLQSQLARSGAFDADSLSRALSGAAMGPLANCVDDQEMLACRTCSICILVGLGHTQTIDDDHKVFVLPCDPRHLFHCDCLRKWFRRSAECPICRSNVRELMLRGRAQPGPAKLWPSPPSTRASRDGVEALPSYLDEEPLAESGPADSMV